MTDDVRHLLGGYATGTLTPEEQDVLFRAAVDDQELFNALADEEALRAYLADPAFRGQLLKSIAPKPIRKAAGMRWVPVWGVAAAGLALAFIWVGNRNTPKPVEMAVKHAPAMQPPPAPAQSQPLPAKKAPPNRKMKVAVLDFDSGNAKPEVGQGASDLLTDKLKADGVYSVIPRADVQNAARPPAPPATAAEIGRKLGADAVVVGQVGGANGFAPKAAPAPPPMRARLIDSNTGRDLRTAQASTSVKDLAVALEKPAESKVTDVNGGILTLDAGKKAGVKMGDKLMVTHDRAPIGIIVITSAEDAFSVGRFEGKSPAQIGDLAIISQK